MVQTIPPPSEKIVPFLNLDLTSLRLTAAQFEQVCRDNPDLRLELTSNGGLIVMPPAGSKTGQRNFNLTGQFMVWVEKDGSGIGFDSSAGFTLPDGAVLSPDVSWVRRERWDALSEDEQELLVRLAEFQGLDCFVLVIHDFLDYQSFLLEFVLFFLILYLTKTRLCS